MITSMSHGTPPMLLLVVTGRAVVTGATLAEGTVVAGRTVVAGAVVVESVVVTWLAEPDGADVTGTIVTPLGATPDPPSPPQASTVRAGTDTSRIRRVHIIRRTVPNQVLR